MITMTGAGKAPVLPALNALAEIRKEMKKRIGKDNGHLNRLMQSHVDCVETTLKQIQPLQGMLDIINQHTEVAVHQVRIMSRMQNALPEATTDGDDGSSETKGE